jgi:glycosyltransferase involved in cell wall biosynthesis
MQLQVLHISTRDGVGGAAQAAYRLHKGLLQTGIVSRMLVADKSTDDENVSVANLPRRLDHRLRRFTRRKLISADRRRINLSLKPGSEFFSAARTGYIGFWGAALRNASVVNLHWVAEFLDYPSFFNTLPSGKPLVWTLHDLNPFTGGCHYTSSCEKFTNHCGACPQLQSPSEGDISHRTFDIKANAYTRLDRDQVVIVGPSAWVAREVRRSALLGRFRVEHIPYGLDLEEFRPRDRETARKCFDIRGQDRVILFVSDYLHNHRKGLDLLLSALEGIDAQDNLILFSVGTGIASETDKIRWLHLGRLNSDLILSLLYNIADVFVIPSREEQFGQTAAEAIACGCPVVGFAVGGVPDIVEERRTGFLAAPFDIRQLRDAIQVAIAHRDELSAACRARAERLFGLDAQAKAYTQVYSTLLARNGSPRSPA